MENKFLKARVRAEILEELYKDIQRKIEDVGQHYAPTGEKVQDYDWEDHKKVLVWEDEEKTIPKMVDKYDYIPYTDEELKENPEIGVRIESYENILTALEKML